MSPRLHARRKRVRVGVLSAAAAVAVGAVAIVLALVASGAPARQAAPPATPSVTAPPANSSTATSTTVTTVPAAVSALANRIDPLLAQVPSCVVVADSQGVVYGANATTALAPASTQKLLVALAALQLLGPDYRFVTKVVGSSAPQAGVVNTMWLVGGGDPALATGPFAAWRAGRARYMGNPMTDFDALVPALKAAGVTSVPGGIHGDDTRYDDVRLIASWPASALSDHEISPLSALTLNEGYQAWLAKTVVPSDGAAFAVSTLSALLAPAGINAPAGPDGRAPANGVVLAQVTSAALSAIVGAMLRSSDNQIAELLVKELGYHQYGIGTTAGGLSVVESTVAALGVPLGGVVMLDGSGLDYGDRSTCATLLATLTLGSEPQFSAIDAGLAVAGQSGTMAQRYRGTPEVGKLRAKSGSTALAGGLVGVLDLGHPVRFAMLFNVRESDALLFAHEDAVVAAIAPYAATGP